jgi:nucleotide-binding universal stress UspA family protein
MAREATPVLIAYDGSELSQAALRQAAELFPGRPAVIATVWESGLATMVGGGTDPLSGSPLPPDPDTVETVDRLQRDHASTVASRGAELARSLGLDAEPHPVPDEVDVADTLIGIAHERDAAVVVVGTHGIAGLRSHLVGSVARRLIEHCGRPVLVMRGERR